MQNANEPRGETKMRPIRTARKQKDEKNRREQTQIKEQNLDCLRMQSQL